LRLREIAATRRFAGIWRQFGEAIRAICETDFYRWCNAANPVMCLVARAQLMDLMSVAVERRIRADIKPKKRR
jgi:hypothetical protein